MTDQLDIAVDLNPDFSRRTFLAGSAGALLVFTLESNMKAGMARAAGGTTSVNGTISIDAANNVVVTYPIAEMGQGTMTGLAQCVAEEMVADWSKVTATAADWAHSGFTGGSTGLRTNWMTMRVAGAKALDMLRQAAADYWTISASDARLQPNGHNQFAFNGATRDYKDLAAAAATKTPAANPTLVPQASWRIMGLSKARLDIPSKVDGSAVFGLDVQLPNMLYAAVRQCPTIGGTLSAIPATPAGATAVLRLAQARTTSTYTAVALVADNSWMPMNYCSAGKTSAASTWRNSIKWTMPAGYSSMTSSTIATTAKNLLNSTTITQLGEDIGTAASAFAAASKKVDATYEVPYLVHAMMEVPNCTVRLAADLSTIEVWIPTQNPGPYLHGAVATIKDRLSRAGLTVPDSGITINATLVGGGFGRKFDHDFLDHAVQVAIGLRAKGINRPVKLFWPRTEDFSHGQYRPMAMMRVRLGLGADNTPTAYFMRHVSQSPLQQRDLFFGAEGDNVDGAIDTPYAIANKRVEYARLDKSVVKVPVGWWRSVGEGMNVFAVESAMDEAAALAGVDPLTFRQNLLAGKPAILAVLNQAASRVDWSTNTAGRGKGIALSTGFGSYAAVAVEVSQPTAGVMKVERMAICIDPGVAINPDQIRAQMEGGLIMGLSAARWGKVTFSSGRASTTNFGSGLRLARFGDVPPITIDILESGGRDANGAGGVGEVGVPAVAPALANAWFRLTGVRKRALPLG